MTAEGSLQKARMVGRPSAMLIGVYKVSKMSQCDADRVAQGLKKARV